ncbi:MAG: hypothetical protein ACRAVC_14695 [Trichormus sp.]
MNSKIYIGMVALPIYLYNADVNLLNHDQFASFSNKLSGVNFVVAENTNTQSQMMSSLIAGRDEQTEDCLRSRICQD